MKVRIIENMKRAYLILANGHERAIPMSEALDLLDQGKAETV